MGETRDTGGGVGVALAQEKGKRKVRSRWELVCDRIAFKIP